MRERQKLLELILDRALLYDPEKGFRLSSGKLSTYYFDCKRITLFSEAVFVVGKTLWEGLKGKSVEAVGGLTLGADPVVVSVLAYAATQGIPLEGFIVRKEPKGHGTKRWIEGFVRPGMKTLIVDDVVTTGDSLLKAAKRAEEEGLEVVHLAAIIDREEGGRERLISLGYEFSCVFTFSEIKSAWEARYGKPFLTEFSSRTP